LLSLDLLDVYIHYICHNPVCWNEGGFVCSIKRTDAPLCGLRGVFAVWRRFHANSTANANANQQHLFPSGLTRGPSHREMLSRSRYHYKSVSVSLSLFCPLCFHQETLEQERLCGTAIFDLALLSTAALIQLVRFSYLYFYFFRQLYMLCMYTQSSGDPANDLICKKGLCAKGRFCTSPTH